MWFGFGILIGLGLSYKFLVEPLKAKIAALEGKTPAPKEEQHAGNGQKHPSF